jgi:hypothetical protein
MDGHPKHPEEPLETLIAPEHTQVLCPKNLCPTLDSIGDFSLDFCRSSAEDLGSKTSQSSVGGTRFC